MPQNDAFAAMAPADRCQKGLGTVKHNRFRDQVGTPFRKIFWQLVHQMEAGLLNFQTMVHLVKSLRLVARNWSYKRSVRVLSKNHYAGVLQ